MSSLAAKAARGAANLMKVLDQRVVGQKPLKEALILSLISREHLYVEGPPGIGKTALAEAAVRATGRRSFFAQLHRDTRLSELIGDAVIRRERCDETSGEVIRSDVRAGALLTAEVAVLDDISRAPGEALNVLLRLLNERKYHERPIPLWSAVATGNPTSAEFYNEPLDPATLDRFALQIRTEGLVASGEWDDAASVVDSFGDSPFCVWRAPADGTGALGGGSGTAEGEQQLPVVELDVLHEALQHVPLTEPVRDGLLAFLHRLRSRHNLDHHNSLLTDRTFLTKAPRLIRASAVLEGREAAHPDDLRVLKLLTTFRVPEELESTVNDLIEEVAAEARQKLDEEQTRLGSGGGDPGSKSGGDGDGGAGGETNHGNHNPQGAGEAPPPPPPQAQSGPSEPKSSSQGNQKPMPAQSRQEREEALQRANAAAAAEDDHSASGVPPLLEKLLRLLSPPARPKAVEMNVDAASVRGLLTLIGVLRGEFEKHVQVTRGTHTDGVPRGWRRMRGLESFAEDADPVHASSWLRGAAPELPDAVRRAKPQRGGALAICRDVSTSMHGINAKYASSLALRVIELAQRRRMRVALLEYSDEVNALRVGANTAADAQLQQAQLQQPHAADAEASSGARSYGRSFFTTDYAAMRAFARRLECGGLTDYEAPLKRTLDEFASDRRLASPFVPKHVLFISDGHPTKGDRRCVEARKRMRRAGVMLHTLFVEPEPAAEYPPLLAALADDSNGVRMRASVVDADAGVIDVTVESDTGLSTTSCRFAPGAAGRRQPLADVKDFGLEPYPSLKSFFAS